MSDTSIIITGKLHKNGISTLDYYGSMFPVIISCWEDDPNVSCLNSYKTNPNFKIIKTKAPLEDKLINEKVLMRNSTFPYQIISIVNSLKACTTKYVIKVRCDESWPDLLPLIELYNSDTNKLVCGNVFWSSIYKHHIGDHIWMGQTKVLLETWENIYKGVFQHGPFLVRKDNPICDGNPECCFYLHYIESAKRYFGLKRYLFDYLDCLNINTMNNYVIQYACYNLEWKKGEWPNADKRCTSCITSGEELKEEKLVDTM